MLIKSITVQPEKKDAIFSIPTGQRASLSTDSVTLDLPDRNSILYLDKGVRFDATATDVFMEISGIPKRLFVDVSADFFGKGVKHIWLADGSNKNITDPSTANVRMVDTIASSNCAMWECKTCGSQWVSPSKLPCTKCASARNGDSTSTAK